MNIAILKDDYTIKSILSMDNMYEEVSYDDSPDLDKFNPTGVWFGLLEGEDIAGIVNLIPLSNTLWMPHIYIRKQFRGKGSEKYGLQVIEYMKHLSATNKFLAMTPYESAKKYAEKLGFKYITTLPKSIIKDGKLLDQYVLGEG